MNRHARRAQQAQAGVVPDMKLVVDALRAGRLKVELAGEVVTGWQMLRKLKATDAGRRLLEQACALVMLQEAGHGTPEPPAADGTTLQALSVEIPINHPARQTPGAPDEQTSTEQQ